MIEIKQLQYFTVCAREGSFSKASEVLYTTQPNVSRVIRDMENELGFSLFQRKGRGIFLTKEGERVSRFAERILRSADMLHAMTESTKIDYFCLASVSGRSIAHQFSNFCDKYFDSEIVCKYVEGNVDFVVKQVENYLAEIGFVYVSVKQLPDFKYMLYRKHLVFKELNKSGVAVSFCSGTTFEGKTQVDCEDLKSVRFIRTAEDQFSLENHIVHLFGDADLQKSFDRAIVTNSGHAMAQMLREVPNLCHLNTLTPESEEHRGGIKTLPVAGCEDSLVFGYICHENEELSDYGREFLSSFVTEE
jgi:DNA-binding transcriptional LysR family regulator